MEFQHEWHDHPFILNEYNEDKEKPIFCYGCKEEAVASNPTYSCLQCNLHLHKSCAELPIETMSILHPEHSLYLLLCPSDEHQTKHCNCCSQSLNGFSYGCSLCRFYVHPRCAVVDWETNSLWTRKGGFELHRIHQHPLVFKDESEQEINRGRQFDCCVICQKLITSEPTYSCPECTNMRIHKSCAELPPVIGSPFEPSRPLFLFAIPWIDFYARRCTACKSIIKGFFYSCPESSLFLHLECSSPVTNDEDNHPHTFLKLQTFISFMCRACGEEDEALPWICTICHILVHRKCSLLPQILKVFNHPHSLHLKYNYVSSRKVNREAGKSPSFCNLCYHKVDTTYSTYRCFQCNYITHLDCAVEERNDNELDQTCEADDEVLPSEAFDPMKNPEKEETNTDFKHFSHPHGLTFRSSTEELGDVKYCEGCLQLIDVAAAPCYCCVECDFFLHKRCAALSRTIRHPVHPQHKLALAQLSEDRGFVCKACVRFYSRGFFYRCKECNFTLDVLCSSFMDKITHPGHKHPLMFAQTRTFDICSACGGNHSYKRTIFVCTGCNFRLDFKCAMLPLIARYRQDSHLLHLTYAAEDDSGEYYCDICEEERNPDHWYYHCADCFFSAHPNCVLGDYTHDKFGVYEGHPHVLESSVDYDRTDEEVYCHACNVRFDDFCILKCTRPLCKFGVHAMGDCFQRQRERGTLKLRNR